MLKKLWDDIKAFFLGLFSEAIKVEGKVVQLTDDAGKVLTRDVAAAYRKSGFVVKEVETTAFKVGRLLDDKRMFGVLWILLALTAPFFLHITVQTVTIATVLGFVLWMRSEEHTSELQSRFDLVCRLLLEKKNISHPT